MIRSIVRRTTRGRWPAVRPGEVLTCPEVGRRLQSFLDGELDDTTEADLLAEHLDDCKRCGLEADTYRTIKDALAARRQPVPQDSVDRLRDFAHQLTAP